jgi:amidase
LTTRLEGRGGKRTSLPRRSAKREGGSIVDRPASIVVAVVSFVAFLGLAAMTVRGQSSLSARVPLATFDVTDRSIEALQSAMQAGEVTSRQLVDLYLARITAYDQHGPSLNSIVSINPLAHDAAAALDSERSAKGPRGPLHGIPVIVKDNYETIEMPTSAGSIALATFHPLRDAFQVQRLKAAGAVILAKTNMHELASGITTVGSRFGQTKNPYDLDRNPGGSSGGTGAAVAASFAAAGMGSDTCGSIRNPASHSNLVGLRGTQGLSSRAGIVPLSSTQDIGGPIARSIGDLAIMLDATVGVDPADPSTASAAGRIPRSYRAGLVADSLKGARLGAVRTLFGNAIEDEEVSAIVLGTLSELKKAGAEVTDVVIPGLEDLLRDSSMINSDFKFDFAEYLVKSEDPPVKSLAEILERGLFHAALESQFRTRNAVEQRESETSRRARVKRMAIRQAVEAVLAEHRLTALVYPTLRRKPARIGDLQRFGNCQLSAHSGLPALAVPAGFSADGLPVGMDLLGSAFTEQDLLTVGYSIEQTLRLRRRPFSTPALVNGKPPELRTETILLSDSDRVIVDLTYDETVSQLRYALRGDATAIARISAIWLHSGTAEKPGAARHQLFREGQSPGGTLALSYVDRQEIAQGRLLARVFQRARPGSSRDVPVSLEMVRLPKTSFVMGTDEARVASLMSRFNTKRRELFVAESPAHQLTLQAFSIDRTEVSNAAFKRFVDDHPEWSRDRLPKDRHNGEYLKTWSSDTYPSGEGELPVTFITWNAASAYCQSLGKRLPKEAEWELAAGGGAPAEFAWGDESPDSSKANFSQSGLGRPVPVATYPSFHGLFDMAGNVWEFVEERWTADYSSTTVSSDRRVIRGGSFGGSPVNLRVRYRDSHPDLGAGPHVGFRCARTDEVNGK